MDVDESEGAHGGDADAQGANSLGSSEPHGNDSNKGVGAGVDWRDDELTRRLLEMELLAEELQRMESSFMG